MTDQHAIDASIEQGESESERKSITDFTDEEYLDEFRVDEKSFERGLPMAIGFKMLIVCISVVLFALIEVLIFVITYTKNSVSEVIANNSFTLISPVVAILALTTIMGVLFLVYLLVHFFSKKHEEALYCKFFKRRGLFFLLVYFLLVAAGVAFILTHFTEYNKIIFISTFIAAFIAFIPIAIAWNVNEEERLKNFIDGFSKACSCMAFMGGAVALLIKTFIA